MQMHRGHTAKSCQTVLQKKPAHRQGAGKLPQSTCSVSEMSAGTEGSSKRKNGGEQGFSQNLLERNQNLKAPTGFGRR